MNRLFSLAFLLLLIACSGGEEKSNTDEIPELPKIEFQNFNERISYCIGMDHAIGSFQVYNGPKTKGKFDNDELTAGMIDYLADNQLRIPVESVDSILDLYLLPGGQVNEQSVSKKDASYAIGLSEGQFLVGSLVGRGIDQDIEVWFLTEGIKAGMKRDESVVKASEAQTEVRNYFNDINKKMGEVFLENNAKRDSVITTESGLQYQVIAEGNGQKPNLTDSCTVNYTGFFIDGRAFESTIPSGRPATFGLLGIIPGWQEGLQLMKEGSSYRFYIPYYLGYGEEGSGPIPPYSTLVFDIELLKVKRFK